MSLFALRTAAVSMLLAGVMACGVVTSVRPHARTPREQPMPSVSRGPSEADPPPRTTIGGELPNATRGTRSPDERRVCRTSSWPRGWIAVAYVSAPEQCPARAGADSASAAATAALVTRYDARPIGAVLDVCADEATPVGWENVTAESAEDSGRCPGAARGDGPATKRIRRLR